MSSSKSGRIDFLGELKKFYFGNNKFDIIKTLTIKTGEIPWEPFGSTSPVKKKQVWQWWKSIKKG